MKSKYLSLFFVIFFISGFSGLIYQSIWTHYLKLFLGHASYAQILVLIIFMGGMALGSAISARLSGKLSNLILIYGICEGLIGLSALVFHATFNHATNFALDTIFPALDSAVSISIIKWTMGAVLILPQSILLGATFPLLAGGLLRRFPMQEGRGLAMLYFVNSIGASIGILFNAFLLIPNLGLPGAIMTAGLINILLFIVTYALSKNDSYPSIIKTPTENALSTRVVYVLLAVAGMTGFASFMYEIAWIRMLSMVLGSSTHSFEIMLSAFILGLAIGGFILRNKLDSLKNPIKTLLYIQVAMGILAILTIPFYNYMYHIMAFMFNALTQTNEGYFLFLVTSLFISMLIMLPATICAGTTLPLITFILLKHSQKDSAIGKIYAVNTFGSILGVLCAIGLVMPFLGLKWVIGIGAWVDIAAGFLLLTLLKDKISAKVRLIFVSVALIFLIFPMIVSLNKSLMASGVFRYGDGNFDFTNIAFQKDGRSSTVVVKKNENFWSLLNNGKPDAALAISLDKGSALDDEPTMIVLGTLPFLFNSDPENIAAIGLGSGLTTHTLLGSNTLKQMDTIEIEPAVYEATQLFKSRVNRIFTDSRSDIHFDDAKTFFAAQQKRYDVIISEPSNPWVSGISGLFSEEFYHNIKRYLNKDGHLVQWIQMYELSPELVSSIYWAMRKNFSNIYLYRLASGDMAMVASNSAQQPNYRNPFNHPKLVHDLNNIKINTPEDLKALYLGNTDSLSLFFSQFGQHANSDFFPILDIGASKARFMNQNAASIFQLKASRVLNAFTNNEMEVVDNISENNWSFNARILQVTRSFNFFMDKSVEENISALKSDDNLRVSYFKNALNQCSNKLRGDEKEELGTLFEKVNITFWQVMPDKEMLDFYKKVSQCKQILSPSAVLALRAHQNWLLQKPDQVFQESLQYLLTKPSWQTEEEKKVVILLLGSTLLMNSKEQIKGVYSFVSQRVPQEFYHDMEFGSLIMAIKKQTLK